MFFEDCQIPGTFFCCFTPQKEFWRMTSGLYTFVWEYIWETIPNPRGTYLFSPICLDSLVNSMDSKLDWSHFSLNFLPRQIWKATTQLLFVVRNACCFFPMWRKSKCVDLFHGDLCMGPHTFQGKGGSFVRTKIPDVWSKASEISAETSTTWLQSGVIHHEYLFVQLAEPHFREVLAVFYENLLSCEICAFTTKNQKQTLAGMAWNLTLLKGVGFGICWYLQLSSWCVLFSVNVLSCAKIQVNLSFDLDVFIGWLFLKEIPSPFPNRNNSCFQGQLGVPL